jgi:hypothetical protein
MPEILDSTKHDIEDLIDGFGLKALIGAIGDICLAKYTNSVYAGIEQDRKQAEIWKKNGVKLINIITKMEG